MLLSIFAKATFLLPPVYFFQYRLQGPSYASVYNSIGPSNKGLHEVVPGFHYVFSDSCDWQSTTGDYTLLLKSLARAQGTFLTNDVQAEQQYTYSNIKTTSSEPHFIMLFCEHTLERIERQKKKKITKNKRMLIKKGNTLGPFFSVLSFVAFF